MMTPSRPYLLRAILDWINDNHLTPHLLVDATCPGVVVPEQHVRDGQIVLNVALTAVRDFLVDAQVVSFSARFGGVPMSVWLPMAAIKAVYARENGRGMVFQEEDGLDDDDDVQIDETPATLTAVDSSGSTASPGGDDEPPSPPRGRPSLKVVR